MEPFGLDVQDPLRAGGGDAPRLLDDEGYGVALVQQPQLRGENPKNRFNQESVAFSGEDFSVPTLFCCTVLPLDFKLTGPRDDGC